MSTDTLTSEAPMVDVFADFDVLRCYGEPCSNEAQWIGRTPCGCIGDIPACAPCKADHDWWIRLPPGYVYCDHCGMRCNPEDMKWIPL